MVQSRVGQNVAIGIAKERSAATQRKRTSSPPDIVELTPASQLIDRSLMSNDPLEKGRRDTRGESGHHA